MFNTVKYLLESQFSLRLNSPEDFFNKRFKYADNLYFKDLRAHFNCVNALEFSKKEPTFLISGGDDTRVLLWNIHNDVFTSRTPCPIQMKGQHHSNIFTLAWDNEDQRIFSGGNDHQVIIHQVETREVCDIFLHENAVMSLSVHPNQSQIFATACQSGEISLFDIRLSSADPIILSSTTRSNSSRSLSSIAYNSCSFSPLDPNFILTGHETNGLSLIDVRMKKIVQKYRNTSFNSIEDSNNSNNRIHKQNIMSACFNRTGTKIAAVRFDQRPILYNANNEFPIGIFDHEHYSNRCTQKSCCFAGNEDQYLVTGSDNFSVYVWEISSGSKEQNADSSKNSILNSDPHLVLKSHRSIINQCRFNYKYNLLATCGVEKIVKILSPYSMPDQTGGDLKVRSTTTDFNLDSNAYSNYEIFDLNDIRNRHSYSALEETVEEDQMIIAYFDSQVERLNRPDRVELNEFSSESESSDEEQNDSRSASKRSLIIEECEENDADANDLLNSPHSSSSSDISVLDKQDEFAKSKWKKKKKSIRNRLINLRHRKSLNLTQEADYLNVLDSLNVSTSKNTEKEDEPTTNSDRKDKINLNAPSIEILSTSLVEESLLPVLNASDAQPSTSNSNAIKSLSEQKKSIQFESDCYFDIDKCLNNEEKSENDSDKSLSEKVKFKKLKRQNTRKSCARRNEANSESE